MKRALLVGIDNYEQADDLQGCVNDVQALQPLLSRNDDNTPNFDCKTQHGWVVREELVGGLEALLAPGADFALLYFAGHGAPAQGDTTLVTSDGRAGTLGVSFGEILGKISNSPVREVMVILDCCFSGGAGTITALGDNATHLRNGTSMLTASRNDQPSAESSGRGVFSTFLEGALDGGAADVLGHVTVAGLYAYLSESFGPWDQRPTFKANVDRLHDLRNCKPAVPLETLRQLAALFPTADYLYALDPTYEPDAGAENEHPGHEAIFKRLQECRAAKLVEPATHEHMYFAAMESGSCQLTPLGRHYWCMARDDRI